jgi:sugar phosphate isomerase/epimerase
VKSLLDDNGLEYLELECLLDWFLEPDDERRQAADRTRALLFEAAAVLEPHHIKVANIFGRECGLPLLTERYGELCAEAAERHGARMVYEFMPPDVNVQDLDTALQVVEGAGAPNAAVAIDTWHMAKLGIEPAELERIPPGLLGWFELSDGHYRNLPDPVDETVNHRALPGEGEFPLREYVAAARGAGYDGPWGVEVLSEQLRELPIDQIYDRAHETAAAQL